MGLCASAEERAEGVRSQKIDRIIKNDRKRLKRECRLLLLGSGESGKSTIVKQMKIIHQSGYSHDELYAWRDTVYHNIIESAQILVTAMQHFNRQYAIPENKIHSQTILEYELDYGVDAKLATAIASIWKDEAVIQLMEQESSNFYIMDCAPYFFNAIKRISKPTYVPTVQDVLCARSKTTGITETHFTMGRINIHMFDVGGQRSERRKWIHCFEGVTSIIFCVALSEYDQVLLEEARQNRMLESFVLFDSVVNSRWFSRTSIILFLNKIDLFKVKLPKVPLERYFPDYRGGNDFSKATRYILGRFKQFNRARLSIYPHLTQATDTSNIRLVFKAIKETILQNSLKDSGIL